MLQTSSRSVEFSYVPERSLKSVVVVGQFNNWDRARHPLQRQSDGKTWRGRFEIPVGVYQYLFCEDNERWVPDPAAPKVSDANGNTNSKLVVVPREYDDLPGVPGDGNVTLSAVDHKPDRSDTARLDRTTGYVRLQTRANDVARVLVESNGRRTPMEKVGGDEIRDLWQGKLRIEETTTRYRFILDDAPPPPFASKGRRGQGEEFTTPWYQQRL
ncbi:MAG TPA: alpha amylase N-terminal ig-like domain-containing protein, partial [Fimbriimonas sp.]